MHHDQTRIIAVNNPGGQPRQFCVQFREPACDNWQRSGVYLEQDAALARAWELQDQGMESRVVHYRLPTAA